jgi:hypothetical protein
MFEPLHKIGSTLECKSLTCKYKKECAQHESAGDFRFEDGLAPKIRHDEAKGYYCEGDVHPHLIGAWHI